ncbi:hypothetical protein ACFT9I_30565 [Streptomyces sp. NPDC057137]|uniref:hypothetical protein n=1 Tax=Streptomyces sp. NPDC057137 TaxID=3346030 RepID=UPI003624B0AF
MNTIGGYLVVLALFGLLALPGLIGYAKDRAIDRQLRRAEHLDGAPEPPAGRSPTYAPARRLRHRPRTTAGQAH